MSPSSCLLACCLLLLTACDLPGSYRRKQTLGAGGARTPCKPARGLPRACRAGESAGRRAGQRRRAGRRAAPFDGRHLPARQIPNPAFKSTEVARFDQPWAMTFLPDGRLLVTEKPGRLRLINVATKQIGEIIGVPAVAYGGQGGLGDVVLHPQFASNRWSI